jgi:hypothetical protein
LPSIPHDDSETVLIDQQQKIAQIGVSDYIDQIADCRGPRQRVITQPRPGTDIPLPTGWRRADYTDWLGKPTMPTPSEAKSDGLTHPGRGTLKWQIAARPLTVY